MTERIPVDHLTSDQLDQLYERLEAAESDLAELTRARQHRAYTFCAQSVGHVTVAEFARKIAEKREAISQRAEAVRYANQQKQRAEQAEDLLRIAHDTSNTSEVERACAVERAEWAEAAIARVRAAAAILEDDMAAAQQAGHEQAAYALKGAALRITAALKEPAP